MFKNNPQGVKVLLSASLLNLFLGMIYIWGIFVVPVSEALSWNPDAAKLTASFLIGFFTWGNVLAGRLLPKLGASKVTRLGGAIMAIGAVLAALTPQSAPWLLYVTYGILVGLGGGMGYIVAVAGVQKWFPNHRGTATGICVGIFGLSVTVFAPILSFLLREFSVQITFFILAAVFLCVTFLLGQFMHFPKENQAPPSAMDDKRQYSPREMVKTRAFVHIIASFFLVTVAFFVVNPAVQTLSLYRGFPLEFATRLLMITGIANTAGRFIVPMLSGKMRNETIIVCLMAVLTFAAGMLTFATGALFVVVVTLIPICFGAALSVFPLLTADYFGLKNLAANYGLVGLGFSASALLAPGAIGLLGGYTTRFIAVAVLSALGICTMGSLLLQARGAQKKK